VERSIIDKFRALNSCNDPLVLQLFSVNAKIDFIHKDLFHQTHVNNLVHLNRSRSFYSMLFKWSHRQMGVVIKKPTPIAVPKDLEHTIAKDGKEVAAAFNLDNDHYKWNYLPNPSQSWKKNLSSKNAILQPTMEWTPTKLQPNLSKPLIGRNQGPFGIILSRPCLQT